MSDFPDAVRNAWHLVALSRDLAPDGVCKVTLCGTPLALFRTAKGVGALIDRCPHRNYPLSDGRVIQGALECPYHGWRFSHEGTCVAVPGCSVDPRGDARLAASAVRVTELHGGVFVTLSAEPTEGPALPPDMANPDYDHFWWQQGTWAGRAFDAIENVMDPFHTNHLHHGFIRRRDRRQPVQLLVTSHGDGIDMVIEQARPDLGLMSRVLERDRTRSVSRYYPPTVVQARWEGERRLTLSVSAFFTPADGGSFRPFACFTTPRGFAPAWLKRAAIMLFLGPVVAQDRRALARQHAVMTQFGQPHFVSGPGDLLGNRLYRLWKGETLPLGSDPPFAAKL